MQHQQPHHRAMIMTEPTDIALLSQLTEHNQAALLALYQRYGGLVYGLALRTLRRPGLAEEVTQDVFLKLWQQPERWNPALGQLSSWLVTITRNAAIDRLRREARHSIDDWQPYGEVEANMATLDTGAWTDGQLLRDLLQQLPAEQRELIELAFYRGYTHSELAEGLGIPLGTVKTRLRAGMQRLRALWEAAVYTTDR
ncbi:MAG TPA: RNA polymerase subunit sigma [Chloroflexi bacterium]|nr:RNA polymerase subunit sigma [Chloroflexota bacterium]